MLKCTILILKFSRFRQILKWKVLRFIRFRDMLKCMMLKFIHLLDMLKCWILRHRKMLDIKTYKKGMKHYRTQNGVNVKKISSCFRTPTAIGQAGSKAAGGCSAAPSAPGGGCCSAAATMPLGPWNTGYRSVLTNAWWCNCNVKSVLFKRQKLIHDDDSMVHFVRFAEMLKCTILFWNLFAFETYRNAW